MDNPLYLFGISPEGRDEAWARKRFEAFREFHLGVEREINDPEYSAVCKFLRSLEFGRPPFDVTSLGTYSGVFRLRNRKLRVDEREKVVSWWKDRIESGREEKDIISGECLITGETTALARTHEPPTGSDIPGAKSNAKVVSFNFDSAQSYNKKQSFNSPVSLRAAFQYSTALKRLCRRGSRQRIQIGDATTVFWTERPTEAENLLPWVFDPPKEAEDESQKNALEKTLNEIAAGRYPGELGDRDTPFYMLGLSPNAARISVRFWLVSTLGDLIENLHRHFADLEIVRGPKDPPYPALWQLIRETARESKDIPPLLGGAVIRSVLSGAPYPSILFSSVLRRIRADRELRYVRAAVLKAYLNRNTRFGIEPLEKELTMSLDPDRPEPAYRLGRLFAELEKTQEDAQPGINATIKDRFYGAASATPGSVFPRLIRLNQHHLGKLEKGARTYHEKRIQQIADGLNDFPAHLRLRDQGLFAIGYYHQRQDIFTKKTEQTTQDPQEKE